MATREGYEIRRYTSHEEMKADEIAYWQSRPPSERFQAVSDLTTAAYLLANPGADLPKFEKTLVRIKKGAGDHPAPQDD